VEDGSRKTAPPHHAGGLLDVEHDALALEDALRFRAETEPQSLADALQPAVGRAMRRAAFGAFKDRVRALNRVILYYASWHGLKWHAEALWTGRPFRDVVVAHTVVRPMEQVLLIDRETGLLLCEASREGVERDGDMVSGMLTAIQDFVSHSFASAPPGWLQTVRFGDRNLCIEQGERAVLAGILDGEISEPFRRTFRRTLLAIEQRFGPAIRAFDGDTEPLDAARPHLEACLTTQQPVEERILPATWMILAAPLAALLVWGGAHLRDRIHWRDILDRIEGVPGVVLVEHGYRDGRFTLTGLRDPLAADPNVILDDSPLRDRITARWEPYTSTAEAMVLRRAIKLLAPPPGIVLTLEAGRLKARGTASVEWIERAALLAGGLAGAQGIDLEDVVSTGESREKAWERAVAQVATVPGVVVLDHGVRDGRFTLRGLRDPLATDPASLLKGLGFAPADTECLWEPYESVEPEFVVARARRVLAPPEGVTLTLRDGVLAAEGSAAHDWILRAELLARTVRGVDRFDRNRLIDLDLRAFRELREGVEATTFRVFPGSGDLMPGQAGAMDRFIESVRGLSDLARTLDRGVSVEIRGHTPPTGADDTDTAVSLGLARRFLERVRLGAVDPSLFTAAAMGAEPPRGRDGSPLSLREAYVTFVVKP
jgi:hypothetical protein